MMRSLLRAAGAVVLSCLLASAQQFPNKPAGYQTNVPANGSPVQTALTNATPSGTCSVAQSLYNYLTGHLYGCAGSPGSMTWLDVTNAAPATLSGAVTGSVSANTLRDSVSVVDYGADPSGASFSGTAINTALTNNPSALVIIPPGTYKLNNASGATGLTIPTTFTGELRGATGAVLNCSDKSATAGVCIAVGSNSISAAANAVNDGAVFRGLRVGLVGQAAGSIPLARGSASNYAILINGTKNISFIDLRVDSSTGPCFWSSNNQNLQIMHGMVQGCSADGWHVENGSGSAVDVVSSNTGDDGFAFTQTTPRTNSFDTTLCGFNVSNIRVLNSAARGLVAVGGCRITFSGFDVNGTSASGLLAALSSGFVRPTDVKFQNGYVTNGGNYGTPAGTTNAGGEVQHCDRCSFENVVLASSNKDGIYVTDDPGGSEINCTVVTAGSHGFETLNTTGFVQQGLRADSTNAFGFYYGVDLGLSASALTTHNVSLTNVNRRAWWSDSGAGIVVNGIAVTDDQGTATGYNLGEATSTGPVAILGITSSITDGTHPVSPQTNTATGYMNTYSAVKASSGTRYLCVSTAGVVTSSASACSGT